MPSWGFLFVGGYVNRGPAILLSVVEAVYHDQTAMSLIITDTILCLDHIHRHLDRFFLGSPLLLHVVIYGHSVENPARIPLRSALFLSLCVSLSLLLVSLLWSHSLSLSIFFSWFYLAHWRSIGVC